MYMHIYIRIHATVQNICMQSELGILYGHTLKPREPNVKQRALPTKCARLLKVRTRMYAHSPVHIFRRRAHIQTIVDLTFSEQACARFGIVQQQQKTCRTANI